MSFLKINDFNALSPTDKAIYYFLMNHCDQIFYMHVREIAAQAHVSSSSVMRFVHKSGFDNFPAFRLACKNNTKPMPSGKAKLTFITAENFPQDLAQTLAKVMDKLHDADNLICVGMGASGATAEYAGRRAAALGYNASVIKDPFYPLVTKMKNTSNNVILVYSVSGDTMELLEMLNNFVNNADFTVVAITANPKSPIAMMSHDVLSYTVGEQRIKHYYDLTTQVPAVYLTDALFCELA